LGHLDGERAPLCAPAGKAICCEGAEPPDLVYNLPVRDRRWDFLYDRQKQPVREVILERFAEELARELAAWPPALTEWVNEDWRRRLGAGLEHEPRPEVVRLALEMARLDLAREHEAFDERMRNEVPAVCVHEGERAALELLVFLVTERCLSLKEWAEGARLSRADLVRAVEIAEKRLFRVTLG
jgi:hypothetical protein